MHLTIHRSTLLSKLAPCAAVADRKSPLFLGQCVLLSASYDALELRAFKQPLSIRAIVTDDHALDVTAPGSVAVAAHELLPRVEKLDADEVTLETVGTRLVIRGGKRRHEIGYADGKDFPIFPQCPTDGVTVPAAALTSVLRRIFYAADASGLYVAFGGVSVESAEGRLVATASDRNRAARVSVQCGTNIKAFIPEAAAKFLRDSMGDGEATIATSSNSILVSCDGVELLCSRPAVDPPDYDVVFGLLDGLHGPVMSRAALLDELRSVTPDGMAKAVHVQLVTAGSTLSLSHQPIDGGGLSTGELGFEGGEHRWRACVDAGYMIEALRRLTADKVELLLPDGGQRGFMGIRSGDDEVATIGLVDPERAASARKEAA